MWGSRDLPARTTDTVLLRCLSTRCESFTPARKPYTVVFNSSQRSWVMQREFSWQFSRPPHCVESMHSSTARTMSATETSLAARARR
jgi:hypothetical protein